MKKSKSDLDALLRPYTPFRADLFHAVRPHVTDAMLGQISRADHGNDQKQHLASLMRIRNTGRLESDGWIPNEVLYLCAPNLGRGESEHQDRRIIRVFCNATLLSSEDPEVLSSFVPDFHFACLIELLPTIKERGWISAFQNTAAALLMNAVKQQDPGSPLYGVALLLIGCEGGPKHATDEHLKQLIEWVSSESIRLSRSWDDPDHADLSWLMGWTASGSKDQPHPWFDAVHRLLVNGPLDRSEAIREKLQGFGHRLVGQPKSKR